MMDWTDRHCRYFHRLLSRHALLYTEMVTTGALIHGDQPRHLDFNSEEHPVALQLGGSEPADLAQAAKLGEQWGYDEINLNCGCPSERVQIESYDFVRDFVGTVAEAGCRAFIVHARNAWLQGISPKENRELPPLKPDWVLRLKADFPALQFSINGGITSMAQIHQHLQQLDGVMVGREAYHNPWLLSEWDEALGEARFCLTRDEVEAQMVVYMQTQAKLGVPWFAASRHMLGLRHGQKGARKWRQVWSDHRLKHSPVAEVALLAKQALAEYAGASHPELLSQLN